MDGGIAPPLFLGINYCSVMGLPRAIIALAITIIACGRNHHRSKIKIFRQRYKSEKNQLTNQVEYVRKQEKNKDFICFCRKIKK